MEPVKLKNMNKLCKNKKDLSFDSQYIIQDNDYSPQIQNSIDF